MNKTVGAPRLPPAVGGAMVTGPRRRAQPHDRHGATSAMTRASLRRPGRQQASAGVLELFGGLIDVMPDAMAVVDQTSTIVLVNAQTERLFEVPRGELLGQPIDVLVPERFRHAHRGHCLDYFRAPSLRLMGSGKQLVARGRNGREFPVEISLSPIETSTGTLTICAIRDVTAQWTAQRSAERARVAAAREANEQLLVSAVHAQMLAEKAEQDSHRKDEFLATVSHELRTPLNAILLWARVLGSTACPLERAEHAAAAIARNAAALAHLIDDLLDTSRMLEGAVRLALRPLNLATVAQGALDAIRPLAATRNVDVTFTAATGARIVRGDADRLQQVVWNLLANAIKFTPEGGRVDVVIEVVHEHMALTVTDTGCGISAELLPHVFERFRQADGATTRRQTGLGLGLSIVRQLVELHGGTVEAASAGLGHGARFTVRLPISADDTPACRVPDGMGLTPA